MTVSELLEQLEKHYCDSIAAEFQHLQVIQLFPDQDFVLNLEPNMN